MTALDTGTEDLRAEIDDGVAVITMNRPDRRNAFSPAMVSALGAVLARVETADPAQLDVDDLAGAELDGLTGVRGAVDRFVEAQRRQDLFLEARVVDQVLEDRDRSVGLVARRLGEPDSRGAHAVVVAAEVVGVQEQADAPAGRPMAGTGLARRSTPTSTANG